MCGGAARHGSSGRQGGGEGGGSRWTPGALAGELTRGLRGCVFCGFTQKGLIDDKPRFVLFHIMNHSNHVLCSLSFILKRDKPKKCARRVSVTQS